MYDFTFGNIRLIKSKPENYLIFIKHLLPRFLNSLPDTICVAIFRDLKKLHKLKKKKLNILETGCGSSTIALLLHCALYGGKVYSWDINPSKGGMLKTVISETIGTTFNININKIWKFIPSSSTSKYTGIEILKEIPTKIDFAFLDSAHTAKHLKNELDLLSKNSSKKIFLAIDDAYTTQSELNLPYVNMLRNKIKLKEVKKNKDNKTKSFMNIVIDFFKSKDFKIKLMKNNFLDKNLKKDIYFKYYLSDFKFMKKIGLVKNASKRFATFQIEKR